MRAFPIFLFIHFYLFVPLTILSPTTPTVSHSFSFPTSINLPTFPSPSLPLPSSFHPLPSSPPHHCVENRKKDQQATGSFGGAISCRSAIIFSNCDSEHLLAIYIKNVQKASQPLLLREPLWLQLSVNPLTYRSPSLAIVVCVLYSPSRLSTCYIA